MRIDESYPFVHDEDIVPDFYYDVSAPGPVPPCPQPPPPLPEKPIRRSFREEIKPVERPPELFPIPPQTPPKHTQIQPRCFTCQHFKMCAFKKDYLKTITLIQRDLGSPQRDYELSNKYIVIPDFIGFPLMDQDKYFPKEITFENSDQVGKLWLARFNGINYVNVVYKSCKYYILIQLKYNKEEEIYELKSCQEAFYKVDYELSYESLEEIQKGLFEWREIIINARMPLPPPRQDIVNTTHFSANLNCDMYDWNKEDFDTAIKNLMKKYPNGIPIEEGGKTRYHIATFHSEMGQIPFSPLYLDEKEKKETPYFPPPPPKPKRLKRRDD